MVSVERSFYRSFPALAAGNARRFSQPVVQMLRRVACESRINATLENVDGATGLAFVSRILERLDVSAVSARVDRDNIPAEGPLVVVANHPLGAADALALLELVGSVRSDVRIIANEVLSELEPLAELLLPCSVGSHQRGHGLRAAFRALEREQAVILFPAGEVSRIRPSGVRDGAWSDGFVRFARRSGAPVLPVHIAAHNSPAFYGISMLSKPLAALMLPREMFAAGHSRVTLTVGEPVAADVLREGSSADVAAAMRRHVYGLARRGPPLFATHRTVAKPEPVAAVRRALQQGEVLGATTDGKRIVLLDGSTDSPAMREIGRLRELAFRRVGEGSGQHRDLDRFDEHYSHIVLWDEEALEIVGAYRLGDVARLLPRFGVNGLYSATLFDFSADAMQFLPQSVELGRSFVNPRHWGTRSLDHLWQGIGAYLAQRSDVRWLIGPVSVSARLPQRGRDLIVSFHRHYYGDPHGLARSRNPCAASAPGEWEGLELRQGQARLRELLQACGTSLPTLYRQYTELCEPEGVRFLDFGVDPAFAGCIDGLIRIDLLSLKAHKRQRYLQRRRDDSQQHGQRGSLLDRAGDPRAA